MNSAASSVRGRRLRRTPIRAAQSKSAPARVRFTAFIAYADIPAARHAISHVSRLVARSRRSVHVQPMLWRFDQLAEPQWQEMALREAAAADALVITMRHPGALDARVDAWLNALARRFHGATVSALALIGDEEAWTISLQQSQPKPHASAAAASRNPPRAAPPAPRQLKASAAVAA